MPVPLWQVFHLRHDVDGNHQHAASQQAWQYSREEHAANGDFHSRRINHHHDGGGNQNPQSSGIRDHTSRKIFRIPNLMHARDHDGANRHNRSWRRARQCCKHHTGKNAGNRQSTWHMPNQSHRKAYDAPRNPARGHKARRQNKERNGQQGIVTRHGLKECLRNGRQRGIAEGEQKQDRRHTKADRNGHTDEHQTNNNCK